MRGHIRKRGNSYSVIVDIGMDENGKRKQKWHSGFKTKKEAESALNKLLADIQRGEYIDNSKITLGQFLDGWLKDIKKPMLAPKTYELYNDIIGLYLKPMLGKYELTKLTPPTIHAYYVHLREKANLSSTTINHHHRLLRQALDHAVKWQYTLKNPCNMVETPKCQQVEMKSWNIIDVKKALTIFQDTNIYIHIMIAVHTGMRVGEICGLKWSDFDFKNSMCTVRRTVQRVDGNLIFKEPKTETSVRIIALPDNLNALLKLEKKKQSEKRLMLGNAYNNTYDGYISLWEDGRFKEPHFVSKKFHKILLANPDLPIIRFHDLRHTNASLMLASGVDMKTISERLGHSRISITMDLYAHVSLEMQKKAVKKLEETFQ